MIQRGVTLSKEELEKYLQGEEKIEIEIRDEEDKVVEKKVIVKRVNKNVNNRKRKRNDEEIEEREIEVKRTKRENKINKFIQELNLPMNRQEEMILEEQDEENDDIKKLVEKYLDLGDMNSRMIWKWFYFGQDFKRKVNRKVDQERERSEQTARKELYNRIMEFLVEENEDDERKQDKRNALKERTKRAIRVYKLFVKIGQHRINNIKETPVSTISSITKEEKAEIIRCLKKNKKLKI
ncbi:hypothetical protein RhiirA4_485419 [Rhizophagus irregularis]|uniref:Uncharacterized protein n=1 Tax=Rhizophagus irregularis TaxID=588596 RepID=A0A2I1HQ64_9GLOM|nr:hypothetical protein RhiirA4_485419 [Rhizophagus irregularis]